MVRVFALATPANEPSMATRGCRECPARPFQILEVHRQNGSLDDEAFPARPRLARATRPTRVEPGESHCCSTSLNQSSLMMNPTPWASVMVAPTGLDTFIKTVSLSSRLASPLIVTVTFFDRVVA